MAKSWSMKLGDIKFGIGPDSGATPIEATTFRLLVMGDFSGRGLRRQPAIDDTKPTFIDRDNFDELFARVRPEIEVSLGANVPGVAISFRELEDFHPDRLYQNLEVFKALRELRQKLQSPKTFAEASAQLLGQIAAIRAKDVMIGKIAKGSLAAKPVEAPVNPENLLEQMLESTSSTNAVDVLPAVGDWQRYLHNLVEPHLLEKNNPQQDEFVAMVDEAIGEKMRLILHDPGFQALEAAWRGLFLLVRGIDTDQELKLYFWDASCTALAADLSGDDVQKSRMYKLLVEASVGTQGGEPWAAWIGLYTFPPTEEDADFLGKLGLVAAAAGAPFIAGGSSQFVGCASFAKNPDPDDWKLSLNAKAADAWQSLRRAPQAPYIGLVMPRFILRLPYGNNSSATEQFTFEEMRDNPPHEHFLWGNAALVCGYLLATGFRSGGWRFSSSQFTELSGLSTAVFEEDGERQFKPCAEAMLTDRAVERIADAGLMLLQSVRNSDRVRLLRWQAIAEPVQRLAGRWE